MLKLMLAVALRVIQYGFKTRREDLLTVRLPPGS